jgi:hypothetical protein
VKYKIPVKSIYLTICNLNSVVSGKPAASGWLVLCMMPSLRRSATLEQTDTWWEDSWLKLHYAGIAQVVQMVNDFASEYKHLLCADDQVQMCMRR